MSRNGTEKVAQLLENEGFDDIRTLAEYRAGEIQLESLRLLPGTEMRRRAEETL